MAQPKTAEPTKELTPEERWERYRWMALTPNRWRRAVQNCRRRSTARARPVFTKG